MAVRAHSDHPLPEGSAWDVQRSRCRRESSSTVTTGRQTELLLSRFRFVSRRRHPVRDTRLLHAAGARGIHIRALHDVQATHRASQSVTRRLTAKSSLPRSPVHLQDPPQPAATANIVGVRE